jgi:hypothetical protein
LRCRTFATVAAALRVPGFLGLRHNALLHALKPRGGPLDLRSQGGFLLNVFGAQRR